MVHPDHFVCFRQTTSHSSGGKRHVLVKPMEAWAKAEATENQLAGGLGVGAAACGCGAGCGGAFDGASARVGIWPSKIRRKIPGASIASGLVLILGCSMFPV